MLVGKKMCVRTENNILLQHSKILPKMPAFYGVNPSAGTVSIINGINTWKCERVEGSKILRY